MPEKIIFPRNENTAKIAVCSSEAFVPEEKEENNGKDNRTEKTE